MADHDLPNYQSRSFLLQNLSVYDSCMKDETNMIKARDKIKDCSIDQICYYVYCCLYMLNYVHSGIQSDLWTGAWQPHGIHCTVAHGLL